MTSKEALEILFASYNYDGNYQDVIEAREKLEQDLERLEKLERDNQNDKEFIKLQNEVIKIKEDENSKLKKIIEILKKEPIILKTRFEWYKYDKKENCYYYERNENVITFGGMCYLPVCHKYIKEDYDLLKEYL